MHYANKTFEAAAAAQSLRCVITEKTGTAGWLAFIAAPSNWMIRVERQRLAKSIRQQRSRLPGRVTPFGVHVNPFDC